MQRKIKSVLVLGATGRTGIHIVQQALQQGLLVTALVRDAAKLHQLSNHPNLEVLKGDVTRFVDVYNAVQGNDAVLCAIGCDGRDVAPIIKGTENIIAAIQKSKISRVICLSSFGAGSTRFKSSWLLKMMVKLAGLSPSFDAKAQQEFLLYKANVDFTLVMAGTLVEATHLHDLFAYSVTDVPCVKAVPKKIVRKEVAGFMLTQLHTQQWSRNTVCLLAES